MIDFAVVDMSRLQFALTAMYHFLFVPLTLGLSFMLVIMESIYVMTDKAVWRDATRFWGKLFGINFVVGVATGITMEFQFGTNWAYFSHAVGDVFGAPLAIEGLMAFFLEATFVGLMFFGWDKLSKLGHLGVTFMVAIGTNFSALWILIANGWMQNPVGSRFNPETMRMEITSIADVLLNPVAQAKFVHTVSAGYVTGAVFVLAISAWYLLKGRHVAVARRSFTVAASFGLAAALSVVVLGDESGYALTDNQRMKLASLEAMWDTQPAPASLTLFGIPDVEARETHFEVSVPWVLGIIATHSFDKPVRGINDMVATAAERIRSGIFAYDAVERLKIDRNDMAARERFELHKADYGYALLLKRFIPDPRLATGEDIYKAAMSTVPNVPAMFWFFRIMAGLGFFFIGFFALAFWRASRHNFETGPFMKAAVLILPLPFIAIQTGWLLAEIGRQPWVVEGSLPTFLAASSLTIGQIWTTIIGFTLLYGTLAVIMVRLMLSTIAHGPERSAPQRGDLPELVPVGGRSAGGIIPLPAE
ncbi:cytochrome bd oxidase subunit I [Polymorphobacter multimanifer]|uniref:Cytochrome d ubiquinol oxidase subunit I n=1 Tax=Polymorphobacter multimanifer TaxID=1070431 RepID=A0A841LFW9_9SPHN|nr:cytochrome ubiquinol oxidase subunit I [Polymorphobacter multimanifer]MBB6228695.1 cytochrome d ubiquinol oxidase subunit I [Polymorphobacter multimanifer]GGI86996.1 cytochrome bd oxidase subunit I [Polymorphobacter multimanifer]